MVKFIQEHELEQIARRIWYAKFPQAIRINSGEEKQARFEDMGFSGMSTEFPIQSGEWVHVGPYELRISYPHLDVPALLRVRKWVHPQPSTVPTQQHLVERLLTEADMTYTDIARALMRDRSLILQAAEGKEAAQHLIPELEWLVAQPQPKVYAEEYR